jgi:hypothetical protein
VNDFGIENKNLDTKCSIRIENKCKHVNIQGTNDRAHMANRTKASLNS